MSDIFVAVGSDSGTNDIWYSTDYAVTWNAASALDMGQGRDVTYADGVFVAVGGGIWVKFNV